MSKFGLDAFENEPETEEAPSLAERLAAFPPSGPRTIDLAAVDAAAAPHGFTSREPADRPTPYPPGPASAGSTIQPAAPVFTPFQTPEARFPQMPVHLPPGHLSANPAAVPQAVPQQPAQPVPAYPPAYPPFPAGYPPPAPLPVGRRRRAMTYEPTRHLAVRLTETQYQRFVAFADEHRLTYHDALQKLMDEHEGRRSGG